MSSHTSRFAGGFLRRYAGWNVGMSDAPRHSNTRPRSLVIGSVVRSSDCDANLPSATTTRGCTIASCSNRNGSQVATSSGSGLRLPGGRHLITFAM